MSEQHEVDWVKVFVTCFSVSIVAFVFTYLVLLWIFSPASSEGEFHIFTLIFIRLLSVTAGGLSFAFTFDFIVDN